MNMFKPTAAKTPDEYLSLLAEPRRSEVTQLHAFIQQTIPQMHPHILAGMIGYGTFHYKSRSGREGDWSVVAIASQKNYISVYICAIDGKGKYVAEMNKDLFPKASIGKSCIRFKYLADIDLQNLKKVVLEGIAMHQKFGYGI